jgi:squalene-hopene/tetraprenyl-beta-curcumene cyclase
MQGYYYYLHVFARALAATGQSTITTADGRQIDWANDLIDQLAELQREDGSFVNDQDRWMEGDPHLVTAYALNALQIALGR